MSRRPRAVVFDLDGTLCDSVPDLTAALNRVLEEQGRPPLPAATVRTLVGDGAAVLVRRALAEFGGLPPEGAEPHIERFITIYEADPSARTRLFPGVAETLGRLAEAGAVLGVCTNKPLRATRRLLCDLGIAARFTAVVGGDSYPTRKPSPEPLLGVLGALGVAPADAAFVGDNEHDAATGLAAGVPRIRLLRYGYARVPYEELAPPGGPVELLDGFADVPPSLGF